MRARVKKYTWNWLLTMQTSTKYWTLPYTNFSESITWWTPVLRPRSLSHLAGDYTKTAVYQHPQQCSAVKQSCHCEGPGDIYKVVRRASSAGSGNTPLAARWKPDHAGDLTRMIRLRYIASASAAKNIKPFLSKNAVVVQDAVTNSLVITDTGKT